jgi:hypothetical protein
MLDISVDEAVEARRRDPKRSLIQQILFAKHIARTLGYYVAARFLAKRGWSLQASCWILLKKDCRIS